MSATLRLGLAGAGPWGRNYLRTVARRNDAVVAAVAGRDWESLTTERLDGVIIATPPHSHLSIARHFGELGVAVLIEKPLCLDLDEALAFRAALSKFRAPVLVDHLHLFSPAYRLLKELSPALGRITGIVSAGGRAGPVRPETPPLWDWGPHDVAMALDLLGSEPVAVKGRRTLSRAAGPGVEENYEIELEFAGAVRAKIAFGNAMSPVRRLAAAHERGGLVYDDLAERKLAYLPAGGVEDTRVARAIAAAGPFPPPLDCVVEDFCGAIRAGQPDHGHVDLAVGVVRVLEQIGRAVN